MRLLLDTQILLWTIYAPKKLSAAIRARLQDRANQVFFSAVSIAEIAIKSSLGRPDFSFDPAEVAQAARDCDFEEQALSSGQAARLAGLPWRHRDPFDRLSIAQTIEEGLRLVTTDRTLAAYTDLVEAI